MFLRVLNNHELSKKYIANDSTFAWSALETGLSLYISDPQKHASPFDIGNIPVISKKQETLDTLHSKSQKSELSKTGTISITSKPEQVVITAFDRLTINAEKFASIPQLAKLGVLVKSCTQQLLSEAEEEYVVSCTKHLFSNHLLFEVFYFINKSFK